MAASRVVDKCVKILGGVVHKSVNTLCITVLYYTLKFHKALFLLNKALLTPQLCFMKNKAHFCPLICPRKIL